MRWVEEDMPIHANSDDATMARQIEEDMEQVQQLRSLLLGNNDAPIALPATAYDLDASNPKLYVAGDWTRWELEEMTSAEPEYGAFCCEFTLTSNNAEFQVVQDGDWAQVFHPGENAEDGEVLGPDNKGHGLNWKIEGVPGDVFRIDFCHHYKAGRGPSYSASIGWNCVGSVIDDPFATAAPRLSFSWEVAILQLAEMQRRRSVPDDHAYTSTLLACEQGGAWEAALKLLDNMWAREKQCKQPSHRDYQAVAEACQRAGELGRAASIRQEVHEWGPANDILEYQLAPCVYWNRDLKRIGCAIGNTLDWKGGEPVPGTPNPCWLLPASDVVAVEIARLQEQLRHAGWRLLTCEPDVVSRLDNKATFHQYALELGLQKHLPRNYSTPDDASYPCILKPVTGEFGKDIRIIRTADEVNRSLAGRPLGTEWLLQELILGPFEYSTSLLVDKGRILDLVCLRYEYNSAEYVWPHVAEVGKQEDSVPADHLAIMSALLADYSGFCNFNYKIGADGCMRLFEANTRVGADLACDVPRGRARAMFQALHDQCRE